MFGHMRGLFVFLALSTTLRNGSVIISSYEALAYAGPVAARIGKVETEVII
jgi:hypothetical protein